MPSSKNGGNIKFGVDFEANQASLNKLKKSLQDLQKIKLGDFKGSAKDLDQMKQTAQKVQIALEKAFNPTLNTTNISTFQSELQKTVGSVDQVYNKLKLAGPQGEVAFHQMATEILTTNLKLKQTNSLIDSMGKTMVNTVKWGIASSIMNTFTQSVQGAFQYVQSLEKSLTNIRIVTGDSTEKMAQFAEQANKSAQALGRSTLDYSKASLTFYQQGLNDEDVQARTEATLKAQNITGAGSQMADYLTSVWNGYKVANEEAELYVDKLAAVADSSASDMSQLAIAMSKVASTASTMGVDVDQLNAQIATVVATTRQAPESVGTAFKTIYTRMNDIKTGSEDAEISLGRYSGTMAELGFNVLDATGHLRDTGQVMEEIGGRWQDLTKEQQIYLAQTMGGQRQVNQLMALFDNWTTYSELLNTSLESEGTLTEKNARYMESLGAKMEQLGAAGERVKDALINENELKGGVQALTNLVNLMGNFIESIGGGSTALLAFGSLATQVFQDTIARQINNVITNLQNKKSNDLIKQQDIEKTELFGKSEGYDQGVITNLVDNKKAIQDYYSIMSQGQVNAYNNIIKTVAAQEQQTVALQKSKDAGEQFKSYLAQIPEVAKQLQKDLGSTAETFSMKAREAGEVITQNWSFKKIRQDSEGFVQSITAAFDDLGKSFGGMQAFQNMDSFKGFKQAYNNIMYLQDGIEPTQEQLETLFTTWRNFTKELTIQTGNVAVLDETNSKLELSKAKLQAATNEAENFRSQIQQLAIARSFVGLVGGLGQIASGIKGAINLTKIWQNENLSAGQKILQTFTNLSMTVGMLTNGFSKTIDSYNQIKKATGGLQAAVESFATAKRIAAIEAAGADNLQLLSQEELQAAYEVTGIKAWASLGPYIAIAAAVAAAVGLIVVAYKEWNKEADAAKKANEIAADTKKTYDDLKTSLDNVKSALNDLHSTEDNLNDLTKGTQEWRDALQQCNDKVLELISNYPELAQYVTNQNGQLKLNAEGEQAYLNKMQEGVQNARNASYIASSNSREADATAAAADIGHNSIYSYDGQGGATYASSDQVLKVTQAIDKVVGEGVGLKEGLSGLTEKISNQTGISEEIVGTILQNEDAVLQLKAQLEQNATADKLMYEAMAANSLQDNNTYKGMDQYGKQVANAIAGADLNAAVKESEGEWMRIMQDQMSRFTPGSTGIVQDVLQALNSAQGTNWRMDSNAVRGGRDDRTLAFLDEQGKLHQFTAQQIASTIAAKEALQNLGTSAETAAQMLKHIDTSGISGSAQEAVKQWISGQDMSATTRAGLEELKGQNVQNLLGEQGAQALAKQWDLLKEDGTADIEALNERWHSSCDDMSNAFYTVAQDASISVQQAFNSIKNNEGLKNATLDFQRMVVGDMQKALAKDPTGGLLKNVTDFYGKIQDFEKFDDVIENFDFSKGPEELKKQLEQIGAIDKNVDLSNIQAFVNLMKQVSQLSPEQNYKNVHDITDKLKRGDTIDADQAQTLKGAGVDVDAFFQHMADGSLKLKTNAETFQEYINNITMEPFKAKIDDLQNKIDGIHAFEDSKYSANNMGWEDFSASAGNITTVQQGSQMVQRVDQSSLDTDKLSAQLDFLKAIGVEDQNIGNLQQAIRDKRVITAEELKNLNELLIQQGDKYNNLSEVEKQHLQQIGILREQMANANDPGLDQDVDEEKWENLSEHLQEYADQIPEVSDELKDNADAADDVAQAMLRYDSAIGQVQKNYNDWLQALTSGSIEDQVQATEDLENVYSDLLDLPFDNILSQDFLSNVDNLNLLKQAANGSEQAYNQLAQAAAQDIAINAGMDTSDFEAGKDLIQSYTQDGVAFDDIEVGAFLDDANFIQGLNEMINAADMTAQQATDLLASMGVDAEVESIQVPESQKQGIIDAIPNVTTETVPVPTVVQDETGGTTVENTNVEVPTINYEPVADIAEQEGQKTTTVLRVKSARKASGGGFKYKNSSAGNKGGGGNGKGNKGKGGNGKGSQPKKANKAKGADNKADRYHDNTVKANKLANQMTKLNKQQERLTGKDALKNLQKQLKILQKQNKTIKERIHLQRDQQSELKNNLSKFGATFGPDGTLTNYFEVHKKIMDEYNKKVDQWNSMSGQQQQENKDFLNIAKEIMDQALKDLQQYDKLQQDIAKSIQEQVDNAQQQINNRIKQFELKIEASIDLTQAKRDWNEFKRTVIDQIRDDDILGLDRSRIADISTYYNRYGTGSIQQLASGLKELINPNGTMSSMFSESFDTEIYKNFQTRLQRMTVTDRKSFIEQLTKYSDQLKEKLKELKENIDEIRESVFDAIDALDNTFKQQMDEHEFIGDILEHNMKVIELMYGDEAYNKMAKYYDKVEENNNKELNALAEQKNYWYDLMRTVEDRMKQTPKDSNEYQELEERRKEYQKLWMDTVKDLQSKTEEALELIADKYANTISQSILNLELNLGKGNKFDDIEDEWDRINDQADMYLDKINSAYEIDKLANAYQDAIKDNDGDIAAQQTLNDLMEQQLAYLKDKDKLTQYDVDRANTLLQIEMKRLALEQSRSNKNRLRLRRDSQGNYTYQYTADTQSINKAEQELADAKISLYNADKAAYVDNLNSIQKSAENIKSRLEDIWKDQNLSHEQKLKKSYELQKYYGDMINDLLADNASIRNNLIDSAFEDIEKRFGITKEQFSQFSKEEQDKYLSMYIPQINSTTNSLVDQLFGEGGIKGFVQDFIEAASQADTDRISSLAEVEKQSGEVLQDVVNGTDTLITQSERLLDNNEEQLTTQKDILEGTLRYLSAAQGILEMYSGQEKEIINLLKLVEKTINKDNMDLIGTTQKKENQAAAAQMDYVDKYMDKDVVGDYTERGSSSNNYWASLYGSTSIGVNDLLKNNGETTPQENIQLSDEEYQTILNNAINKEREQQNVSSVNKVVETLNNNIFASIDATLTKILNSSQEYYAKSLANQDDMTRAIVANQNIHIDADFPNAKDVYNIIRAMEDLAAAAAQKAGSTTKLSTASGKVSAGKTVTVRKQKS